MQIGILNTLKFLPVNDEIGVNVQISSSVVSIEKWSETVRLRVCFILLTEIISYTVIVKGNISLFMLTLICTLVTWYIFYNHWPQDRGENNCYLYSSTAFCDLVIARQRVE